jgi:2-polyprenyl-3-methyl-5-hydroxy-6-metoxy-1,4-benzoquinol methylase
MNSLVISTRTKLYLFLLPVTNWMLDLPKPYNRVAWTFVSLWRAVWLGFLDANRLNEITRYFYSGYTGFETKDFNVDQGLWPWEADAVREHFSNRKSILVAGAGGGREVIALTRLGFDVTGFDFSPFLVDACRNNLQVAGFSSRILLSALDGLPEGLDRYDALLIGRGVYHHIPSRQRRIEFLGLCRKHIASGAPVILADFFTRSVDSKFYNRTQKIANMFRHLVNRTEMVELGDWLSFCMQHAFIREEVEKELIEAGIQSECYRISPFDETSRLAYVLGRII